MLDACHDKANEMVRPLTSFYHKSSALNNKEANNGVCVEKKRRCTDSSGADQINRARVIIELDISRPRKCTVKVIVVYTTVSFP